MPSDAAMRAALEVLESLEGVVPRYGVVKKVAQIIDKHMEPPPPTAEEMREHEELYQIRAPRIWRPNDMTKIVSAITTCPRPGVSYLESTLESLQNAGFAPEIVADSERKGSWPTLRRALASLLESDGRLLCVFQDDIQIAANCREWLEGQLWPIPQSDIGLMSLYTPSVSHLRKGWYGMHELPVFRPSGGCAMCFTRHGAEKVLEHQNGGMMSGADTSVACLFRKLDLAWMMHSPSLVEHVGLTSAIHPGEVKLDEWRTAGDWIDDARKLPTS